MAEVSPDNELSVNTIRDGQEEPSGNEWEGTTPEERIEAVWTLTKLCNGWNDVDEPRLQRNITRV